MVKWIQSLMIVFFVGVTAFAEPLITFSGSALSSFNLYEQSQKKPFSGQFETAANLNTNIEFSNYFSSDFSIELGGVDNVSGFSNGLTLGGIQLTYLPLDWQTFYDLRLTSIILGNSTIPFGQYAEYQTNNAEVLSPFLFNDLGYALLLQGKDIGSMSATGLLINGETGLELQASGSKSKKGEVSKKKDQFSAMMFNGFDGDDNNSDQGFGVSVRYKTLPLFFNTVFGLSYFSANELSLHSDGFNANSTGLMLDFNSNFNSLLIGGYASFFNFNDRDKSTKDDVKVFMVYASRKIERLTISGKYSIYMPQHYKGEGVGSTGLPGNIGLADLPGDIEVVRVQASAIVDLDRHVFLHNELLFDTYGDNREDYNTVGFLSYISVNF